MSHVGNIVFMSTSYAAAMATVLLRLSLPDRPGALGAVASRIGAVRGDVISIDIIGRHGGQAIDELVVDIGDERHLSLMLDEIAEVDGVRVDEVQVMAPAALEQRRTPVDAAVDLMAASTPTAVLRVVVDHALPVGDGAWAAVVDLEECQILAATGQPPAAAWLRAYATGARWYETDEQSAPSAAPVAAGDGRSPAWAPAPDVACAFLDAWDLVLVAGRPGGAFTERERRHLGDLGRLADARWSDLASRTARLAHPSAHRSPRVDTALDPEAGELAATP